MAETGTVTPRRTSLAHKLLIELAISLESEFLPFLKPSEVIRGGLFKLTLTAENLGTSKFPGAEVAELKVVYRGHGNRQSYSEPDSKVSCPEIEPVARVVFYSDDFEALEEGTSWVNVTMKANDQAQIEFYQSPTSLVSTPNEWINKFYVVSRDTIHIVALLTEVVKQLKK
jgi:hypothetical protein